MKGDPTEGALVVAAKKAGISKEELEAQAPRIAEIPFSSERKRMTTIHSAEGKKIAYMKGAPEIILERCSKIFLNGKEQPLSKQIFIEYLKVTEAWRFKHYEI